MRGALKAENEWQAYRGRQLKGLFLTSRKKKSEYKIWLKKFCLDRSRISHQTASNSNKAYRQEFSDNLYKKGASPFTLAIIHYRELQCSEYPGETILRVLFLPNPKQGSFHNATCYQLWPIHECWLRINNAYNLVHVHVSWGMEKQRINRPH